MGARIQAGPWLALTLLRTFGADFIAELGRRIDARRRSNPAREPARIRDESPPRASGGSKDPTLVVPFAADQEPVPLEAARARVRSARGRSSCARQTSSEPGPPTPARWTRRRRDAAPPPRAHETVASSTQRAWSELVPLGGSRSRRPPRTKRKPCFSFEQLPESTVHKPGFSSVTPMGHAVEAQGPTRSRFVAGKRLNEESLWVPPAGPNSSVSKDALTTSYPATGHLIDWCRLIGAPGGRRRRLGARCFVQPAAFAG